MKPILFNTEMVRAILDDRKTVTRRCVKIPDNFTVSDHNDCTLMLEHDIVPHCVKFISAKYMVNDILYVRETWGDYEGRANYTMYRADYSINAKTYMYDKDHECDLPRWKPSIHMPKEAARIFLRVTDVRVERLQDMTVSDVLKEGLMCECPFTCEAGTEKDCWTMWNKWEYLWNSTLKKDILDQYGWDANPYVFVYEFEVISKDEAHARDC